MTEQTKQPFAKLKRFVEPQPKPRSREDCEFCGVEIAEKHSHAVNTETRSLMCVCRPCYLLFTHEGAARGKFKAVPERYLYAPGLILTDAQWNRLQIPVGIAFFFFNTSLGRMVVFYPSPVGATESLLSLETWDELAERTHCLQLLLPTSRRYLCETSRGVGASNATSFLSTLATNWWDVSAGAGKGLTAAKMRGRRSTHVSLMSARGAQKLTPRRLSPDEQACIHGYRCPD